MSSCPPFLQAYLTRQGESVARAVVCVCVCVCVVVVGVVVGVVVD